MGREARCTIEHDGRRIAGRVLLEEKDVRLRGEGLRASVAFSDLLGTEVADGWIELRTAAGTTRLQLGERAEIAEEPPDLVAAAEGEHRVGEIVEARQLLDGALGDGRGGHMLA